MDDGGIIGPADMLVSIWALLLQECPKLGLELNPAKCEWSWLDNCTKPCPSVLSVVLKTRSLSSLPTRSKCWVPLLGLTKKLPSSSRKSFLATKRRWSTGWLILTIFSLPSSFLCFVQHC